MSAWPRRKKSIIVCTELRYGMTPVLVLSSQWLEELCQISTTKYCRRIPSAANIAEHATDIRSVFLHGARPDSRNAEQLLGRYRVAGGQSPQ